MRGLACALLLLAALPAAAVAGSPAEPVGQRYRIDPAGLPAPYATRSVANPAAILQRSPGATLQVPPGFHVGLFAENLKNPRWMAVAANGDVLLAEPDADRITVLRDADGDGVAELREVFTDDLDRPHGLAIHGDWLYVGEPRRVVRLPYRPGDLHAGGRAEPVTAERALGDGDGHWTRNLAFAPDGSDTFFVTVGSRGNSGEEAPPRATVQKFEAGRQSTFAAGLRNAVGIAFHPATGELYVSVNERDGLGDGLVPDFFTRIREGEFFGWPYAYAGSHPDPKYGARRPDLVAKTLVPDVLLEAHGAPIGMLFYDGAQFPAEYRGDAFIALQGSWNSAVPAGYKVVRVRFRDGRPVGGYENFATGFWVSGADDPVGIGRPAGLAVARDGSLLVADDAGQAVWRISYRP